MIPRVLVACLGLALGLAAHAAAVPPPEGRPKTDLAPDAYLKSLCAPLDPNDDRSRTICKSVALCDRTRNAEACEVYCNWALRDMDPFPGTGIRFGPTSWACLAFHNRVRGSNWVQAGASPKLLAKIPPGYDAFRYECLNRKGEVILRGESLYVICRPGTTSCMHDAILDPPPQLMERDRLIGASCRSRYSPDARQSPGPPGFAR